MTRTDGTLTRLRIAHLLFGMMFFYGIEQIFLNKIIGNDAARGYTTVVFVASLLVFDIPTGIIADRIGRRKSMLAACVVEIVSLVVLGMSTSLTFYLAGTVLFGLYVALINGASQALLYDWLASRNKTKLYAKYQGSIYALFLIGAGLANILSGYIVKFWGLRSPYFLSVIPGGILAFIIIYGIHEPAIKKPASAGWYSHLGEVIGEIRNHRGILVFSLRLITAIIMFTTIGEFGQIYMLSFGITTVALGIFWAINAGFAAGGRYLAHYAQDYPRLFIAVYCLVLASFTLTQRMYGIGIFWLIYGLTEAFANISETEIQHATSSHIRATTFSVISFVGNAIAIPIILFYTSYYVKHGIFAANKLIIYLVVAVLLATLLINDKKLFDNEIESE